MGDISIIARRISDNYVQYGWSGNGGYYRTVGNRLLIWYNDQNDELIEYLFSLGEFRLLGRPYSEKGGFPFLETTMRTGRPHNLGTSERQIFSKIAFIDFGYFYDSDKRWYYVIPGPFRIKMPLELVHNNLDDSYREFDYRSKIKKELLEYIFLVYPQKDSEFASLMEKYNVQSELDKILGADYPMDYFWDNYQNIFQYFEDWVVVKTDSDCKKKTDFIVRKKSEKYIETIHWE